MKYHGLVICLGPDVCWMCCWRPQLSLSLHLPPLAGARARPVQLEAKWEYIPQLTHTQNSKVVKGNTQTSGETSP